MSFSAIGTDLDAYYDYVRPDETAGMSEAGLTAYFLGKSATGILTEGQQAEIDKRFSPTEAGRAIIQIVGAA